MKNFKKCVFLLSCCLVVGNVLAQHNTNDFSSCAAAFLNQKLIVNEYTTQGKCIVDIHAKGKLTVHFAELSDAHTAKPGATVPFKIAIRDGNTKTLWLFSEKTYRDIPIEEVLAQCQKGDSIVLITTERDWALPHSEILVSDVQ